ncbi:MAG TPA: hypothetical protein IAC38_03725 [Candidatus Caccovivens faecavium]|nr:hypothetical protein [Candidatus Caccovivens faecavium]
MYNLGLIFRDDDDYGNKAKFCNENNLKIVEIEKDERGRRFQIQEIDSPTTEEILNDLRLRRRYECFEIINRGQPWYETLTQTQKEELKIWYKDWLDVTDKYSEGISIEYIIPTRPSWIK